MTTWTTTTAEQDIIEALDSEQRLRYCFSRDWGCGHDEALIIATDETERLFNELTERTFA
jgi:hypothetical protein